jgi:hypothetical protein
MPISNKSLSAGTGAPMSTTSVKIPNTTGFFSGGWQHNAKTKARQGITGLAPDLLQKIKDNPCTEQEATVLAKKLGMTGSSGILLKNKVLFLLKKYGEKGPDGKWSITKPIEPPFFSNTPSMSEVFVKRNR